LPGSKKRKNKEDGEEEEEEQEDDGEGGFRDEPLGSEDDASEDDEPETENLILCQYDKVTHTKGHAKSRWKAILRHGIMRIEGRDYVFQKATGDFDW